MKFPARRSNSFSDAWCRVCHRASRVGQWVVGQDACPYCGVSGTQRLAWSLMRLRHPHLPLTPEIGLVYLPAGDK